MTTFPASFLEVLQALLGRLVQLSLEYPVSPLNNATLPIGRLVAVATDYIAVDGVTVDGVRLRGIGVIFIRQGNVYSIAPVNAEAAVVDLALSLRPGPDAAC